eukprot:650287-Pelagomonas_calceolata.AAC.2
METMPQLVLHCGQQLRHVLIAPGQQLRLVLIAQDCNLLVQKIKCDLSVQCLGSVLQLDLLCSQQLRHVLIASGLHAFFIKSNIRQITVSPQALSTLELYSTACPAWQSAARCALTEPVATTLFMCEYEWLYVCACACVHACMRVCMCVHARALSLCKRSRNSYGAVGSGIYRFKDVFLWLVSTSKWLSLCALSACLQLPCGHDFVEA